MRSGRIGVSGLGRNKARKAVILSGKAPYF